MAESTGLNLIMEKGPREGETLKYSSSSTVKIGRVVRGNTIAIKDAGISSKHICIQFDNHLTKWTLTDLDSSNGTILNGQSLKPFAPSALHDGDCIKIGELTSIIVKIGAESAIRPRRNPRRQAKPVAEKETTELELGFDGGNEVKEPVQKRNLRTRAKKGVELNQVSENLNVGNEVKELLQKCDLGTRAKKGVDLKNERGNMGSKRSLRSSKKERVSFVPEVNQVAENLIEPRRTRGRKKLPVQVPEDDPDLDIVVPGKRTRGGRRGVRVEPLKNAHSSGLVENSNNANDNGSSQIDEGNEETVDETVDKVLKDSLESVKESTLGDNLDTNNESVQEHVVDESCLKGKEVAEELECRKDGCPDESKWQDLEKMTLSDFFDYLEVQLPKEIYDKTEKIISDMEEKARKCHEFRRQRNEAGKGIN